MRLIRAALVMLLAGTAVSCSSGPSITAATSGAGSPGASAGPTAGSRTITVLAASSLTEPVNALVKAFEQAHPGSTVRVSYGSSTTLVQQVVQGAPADIIALAGADAVAQLPTAATTAHPPIVFAENALELATPADNPARVTAVVDLAREGVKVVLCVATAPCGKAADSALSRAGVTAHIVSREIDAKATLAKLRLGEADAGLIYHSDVVSAKGAVTGVPLPSPYAVSVTYALVQLTDNAGVADLAQALTDATAKATYRAAGFGQ